MEMLANFSVKKKKFKPAYILILRPLHAYYASSQRINWACFACPKNTHTNNYTINPFYNPETHPKNKQKWKTLLHSDELVLLVLQKLAANLDVVSNDGDILEVESSVDLVHDVEGCRFVVMQGKDQCQRAQRLLSSWQVGDVLPRLLGGTHAGHKRNKENVNASST